MNTNKACYYYDEKGERAFCIQKRKEIVKCTWRCPYFEVVSASPYFLNHLDILFRNARKIKPLEGFEDVVMHGTSLYFVSRNADGKEYIVTTEEFADILRMHYEDKLPSIRLISCLAGELEDGTAQQLASFLGTTVMAPMGVVVVDFDGDMWVQDPFSGERMDSESSWKLFFPKTGGDMNE